MNPPQLFISAIIPVYNGEAFLADAVSSILLQGYCPLEIIVVDDGSTDDTAGVAARFGDAVRYVYQTNGGPAAARNRGLREALGSVIAFLDADDLWTDKKLEVQLDHLANHPAVDIVVGCTQPVRQTGISDGVTALESCSPTWAALSLGSALIRKSAFDLVGSFNETLHCGEDVDWFLRGRELDVSFSIIGDITLLYRFHDGNMTRDVKARNHYFLRSLKQSLDRRRASGGLAAPLAILPGLERVARNLGSGRRTDGRSRHGPAETGPFDT